MGVRVPGGGLFIEPGLLTALICITESGWGGGMYRVDGSGIVSAMHCYGGEKES